jgi:hypothetical protein
MVTFFFDLQMMRIGTLRRIKKTSTIANAQRKTGALSHSFNNKFFVISIRRFVQTVKGIVRLKTGSSWRATKV